MGEQVLRPKTLATAIAVSFIIAEIADALGALDSHGLAEGYASELRMHIRIISAYSVTYWLIMAASLEVVLAPAKADKGWLAVVRGMRTRWPATVPPAVASIVAVYWGVFNGLDETSLSAIVVASIMLTGVMSWRHRDAIARVGQHVFTSAD